MRSRTTSPVREKVSANAPPCPQPTCTWMPRTDWARMAGWHWSSTVCRVQYVIVIHACLALLSSKRGQRARGTRYRAVKVTAPSSRLLCTLCYSESGVISKITISTRVSALVPSFSVPVLLINRKLYCGRSFSRAALPCQLFCLMVALTDLR